MQRNLSGPKEIEGKVQSSTSYVAIAQEIYKTLGAIVTLRAQLLHKLAGAVTGKCQRFQT